MVAVATLGAGIISAGAGIFGAQEGANAQEQAAAQANALQSSEFNKIQANEQPYMSAGTNALSTLNGDLPNLTAPISMNESTLQQTPGYQFNLTQGLKATQNAAAARGLGVSGAALKGASSYATGLADSTYQNQFANAQTNRQTTYNMLSGLVNTGQTAATGTNNAGLSTANSEAANTTGAGNAAAAADVSSANAVGSGASTAAQGYVLNNLLSGGGNYFGSNTAAAGQAGIAAGLQMNPDGSIE